MIEFLAQIASILHKVEELFSVFPRATVYAHDNLLMIVSEHGEMRWAFPLCSCDPGSYYAPELGYDDPDCLIHGDDA